MYDKKSQRDDPPICNLVPGFAFYNNMGSSLAENLVDLFEAAAALIATIKRKSRQKTRTDAGPQGQQQISSPLREIGEQHS